MVLNLLLLLPMTFSHSRVLWLAPFVILTTLGPPLMYWAAMAGRQVPWPQRLRNLPLLVAPGHRTVSEQYPRCH